MTALRAANAAEVRVDRDGATAGRLVILGGAAGLVVSSADLGEQLAVLCCGGRLPKVKIAGGELVLDWRGFTFPEPRILVGGGAELVLTSAVPWTIDVSGGYAGGRADLVNLHLAGAAFHGGLTGHELLLPPPRGTTRVGIGGGATKTTVRLPRGTEYRLAARGSVMDLDVMGERLTFAPRGITRESDGFEDLVDRYDFVVAGDAIGLRLVAR